MAVPRRGFFCGSILLLMFHVSLCCVVSSVPCCLVVASCRGLASCVLFVFCVFVAFPYGVQGHVWYLVASIPDL